MELLDTNLKNQVLASMMRIIDEDRKIILAANQKDLDAFLEELSALYDKKTLLRLYQHATDAPYSFLYVKLTASNRNDMFYMNLAKNSL